MACLLLALAWSAALPDASHADRLERRLVVGVIPFQAPEASSRSSTLASSHVRLELSESPRFQLVEEERISVVLAAIARSHTRDYSQARAIEVGKLVAARYMVFGEIVTVQSNPPGSLFDCDLSAALQLVEVETDIFHCQNVTTIHGANPEACLAQAASELSCELFTSASLAGIVLEASDDGSLLVDLSARDGIRPGQRLAIVREGGVIRHPATGRALRRPDVDCGLVAIVTVGEESSKAKVVRSTESALRAGDRVLLPIGENCSKLGGMLRQAGDPHLQGAHQGTPMKPSPAVVMGLLVLLAVPGPLPVAVREADGSVALGACVTAVLMPLKPGAKTAPEFAELATREVRAILTKATWLSLTESERVDRHLAEIARSHTRDYDQAQALEVGHRLKAEWVCAGKAEAHIYKTRPEDENSWWGAVQIVITATSLRTGVVRVLEKPIVQGVMGLHPDEAKKMAGDCARTTGQMTGVQLAEWLAPECLVVEVRKGRLLLDSGLSNGLMPKQKFEVIHRETNAWGRTKEKKVRVTVDKLGAETAGAKVSAGTKVKAGDTARLVPNLRSDIDGGLGTFRRSAILGGLSQNPNVRGAVGNAAPAPYTGPPVDVGEPPAPDPGGGQSPATGPAWLTEVPFQTGPDMDLTVVMPSGMVFTPQDELLVSDNSENNVAVYGPDGVLRRKLAIQPDASGPSVFCAGVGGKDGCTNTTAVAVDRHRRVCVGDAFGRVRAYEASGRRVATWDSVPRDSPRGATRIDAAIVGPHEALYAADGAGGRVVKF